MPNPKPRARKAAVEATPLELPLAGSDACHKPLITSHQPPTTSHQQLLVFIDGAARGNPGPASVGVVIREPASEKPICISRFLGKRTNNQAEYEALLVALRELERRRNMKTRKAPGPEIVIHTDSELLFNQMTGRYRIKDQKLAVLAWEARKVLSRLDRVSFEWIPRTENREADKLANQALDRVRAGQVES
jgi:probable phosphoglycerate mutase